MKEVVNKYSIIKQNTYCALKDFKVSEYEYYNIIAKNTKFIEGISISKIKVYDNQSINNIINKKIKKRFKSLLELIASVCESDEDPGSGLMFALTEVERFKRELINKYNKYLKKSQLVFLDKKIELIEKEVQKRLYNYQQLYQQSIEKEEIEELIEKDTRRLR